MKAVDVPNESVPPADEPKGRLRLPHPRRRRHRFAPHVRWGVTAVALFFVLEYLLLPEIANARKSIDLLTRVNVIGLLVGVGLELAALIAYAELTTTVLTPEAPRRFALFRVNMSSLAVSHVLPGGTAPGSALAYRLLTDLDVPGATAAFGLATQGVGSAVVLNAILWLALLISIPLTGYNPLYGFAALVGLILIVLFAGTVVALTRGERRAAERLHRLASHLPLVNPDKVADVVQTTADRLKILLRTRKLLVHALEWAAFNWLFDAASLWVFVLAFGHVMSPVDLLVAYGLANVLAAIPITPSGLGIVEGVLIPTLVGFHVHKGVAILGVLSWRLVNFWIPIPLGGVAYLSLRFSPQGRAAALRREQANGRRNHAAHDEEVPPGPGPPPPAGPDLAHLDAHEAVHGSDILDTAEHTGLGSSPAGQSAAGRRPRRLSSRQPPSIGSG